MSDLQSGTPLSEVRLYILSPLDSFNPCLDISLEFLHTNSKYFASARLPYR